ncbi:MAG: ABC transporter ATP-binding protein [Candidatus Thalassarchaeum sp.]|nr:ABC transporter ATP-binding protein [Candidatus Thalassarchaeum sp.]
MSDNLLEIEGLRVHFDTLDGPIEALHSVDLKVEQGQIMGLVGESGCGKSVTSLVTIGLATCDVDEGSVKYEGEEMLFSDSEADKKTQDISGRITAGAILASVIAFFWTILSPFGPIQGLKLLLIFLFVSMASWFAGFAAKGEYRRHQKFMRWVRGNEISMIFQEPMTALNPLYTVEKQISEVMRVHDRLVEAETPRYVRAGQALVSPATLIRDAFSSRPQASIATSSVLAFVFVAHLSGFADSAADAVATPFVWVFIGVYDYAALHLLFLLPLLLLDLLVILLFGYLVNSRSQIDALNALYRPLEYAAPQVPLVSAVALVIFLMLWMPLSALLGMTVISTLLALPAIMVLDYLRLDPAHTRQVIGILEDVRIPNPSAVVKMYPHELSGGMLQRVMIAMMMSCEPKLLIADEPTTALDVTIQAQILQLMRDLRDEKDTSILLITHDLGVIAEMCDAVTVMYAGSVVESGSIGDVLSRPRMPYSIGLLHSIPTIDEGSDRRDVLPIIPGQVPDPNLHFDGCRFHPRCPFADETCISTPPPMTEVEPGHFAACHHTNRTVNVADVQASFDVFASEYELEGVA